MRRVAIQLLVALAAGAHAQATFTPLGIEYVSRVSRDGTTVVGSDLQSGFRAVRWRASTGVEVLGPLTSGAADCSPDGSVVVGSALDGTVNRAAVWRDGQAMQLLPGNSAVAWAVSDSTEVFAGVQSVGCYWDAGGLHTTPPPNGSHRAMNSAGTLFVGSTFGDAVRGYAYDLSANLLTYLPNLNGGTHSQARDVTPDGSIIVGRSLTANNQAVLWDANRVCVSLGGIPDQPTQYSDAYGVTPDGQYVVGEVNTWFGREPFLWSPTTGMKMLRFALIAEGASIPSDFLMEQAVDVTRNGDTLTIIGRGYSSQTTSNEAWVATIVVAEPSGTLIVLFGCTLLVLRQMSQRRRSIGSVPLVNESTGTRRQS